VDLDLFTTDARVLQTAFWTTFSASVDVRRGDDDDPLAGVIRITAASDRDVDLVVGRSPWQAAVIARARPMQLDDVSLPVVSAADLVLLKLYAGGALDAWDIEQLLAAGDRDRLVSVVDGAVAALPQSARQLWQRLREPAI
jgi:hypothetical protein